MTESSDVPVDVTMAELTELVQLFNESDWNGLEVKMRGIHVVLGRRSRPVDLGAPDEPARAPAPAPVAVPAAPLAPPAAAAASETIPTPAAAHTGRRTEVTAPVVGTFWTAPSPGEPPFVEVGDDVQPGQQLAIVEVMKLMSDVSSPVAGRVVEVRASNAQLVEFGQVLFVIESDDG